MPTAERDPQRSSRLPALSVAAITLVALLLRLPSFGNALFGDEVGTYFVVTGHSVGQILHLLNGHSVDLIPPLYYLLARITETVGSSPQLLRLTPLIAGTAAVPLTYLLGTRTVGTRAGIAGAALMALSPLLIFYSTEARAYALVMLLVLGSTYAMLRALETESGMGWWVAYAGLSCAAVYTHYTAVFPLLAALVWGLITNPRARAPLIGANVAAAIGFLPWLPALIKNTQSFGTKVFGILEPFSLHAVAHDLAHWSIGHPFLTLATAPGRVAIVMIVAGAVLAILSLAAHARGVRRLPRLPAPVALPALLALSAPVGLGLYSTISSSVWDLRNLIVSWPWFALVAGILLTSAQPPLRLVPVGLVLTGFAIGAVQLLSASHQRPDYTAAARFVLHDGAPNDPIAIVAAPTPGPPSAVDAALAYAGASGRPLLRVGSPPLAELLRAPPYALLPSTPPSVLAAQAARTPRHGKLFVIAPGTASLASLLGTERLDPRAALGPVFGTGTSGAIFATIYGPLSAFVKASARWFSPLQTTKFPGVLGLSVYVFERR